MDHYRDSKSMPPELFQSYLQALISIQFMASVQMWHLIFLIAFYDFKYQPIPLNRECHSGDTLKLTISHRDFNLNYRQHNATFLLQLEEFTTPFVFQVWSVGVCFYVDVCLRYVQDAWIILKNLSCALKYAIVQYVMIVVNDRITFCKWVSPKCITL